MVAIEVAQAKSLPRRGRPSKDQAGRITKRIIEGATRLFSERGFEPVSIDLITTTVGISKQTFYNRFQSKEILIAAVIRQGVNDLLRALTLDRDRDDPLATQLIGIATELVERSLLPAGIWLDRLVSADAPYAPQLALAYYDDAFIPARDLIAEVFADFFEGRRPSPADLSFIAEQFLHAVVGGPARVMILSGQIPKSRQALAEQVGRAVSLFLDGCRMLSDPKRS